MGYQTTASGDYSTAMGRYTTASGDYSSAIGYDTTASGWGSTAMGISTTASGWSSTAMGMSTTASGIGSTAMGLDTIASGQTSTAMGSYTKAIGQGSTAIGQGSAANKFFAIGQGAVALGYSDTNTAATGKGSIALGYIVQALAEGSVALGKNIINSTPNSVAVNDLNVAGDANFSGNVAITGMLFGGSPLLICSKDSENCLVIIPEEKQYIWCDYQKETCDTPNLSAISKIREVKQAITLQNEKRACQSKSGGWFWLGSQCSFSNEIECESRGQEYYWSGSECLVNPYWDCQLNHADTSDWNGTACVFSQKKADQSACKKQ
jgi:hypothetical protein